MSSTFNIFEHKIKSLEEIVRLIGQWPRKDSVIMCHGVFDVVHPGHVRHLAFAKSKAKILIASLTADKHIKKGKYRPHVPQQIRAQNLAAFEMVDYVIIDHNATPLENINLIKPDYFAKGFEYSSDLPPETREEAKVVESYGGKMIFTPGDVVYSSSKFIELSPPNLDKEKLISLMHHYNVTFDDLRNSLMNLNRFSIHVVGDTIIDSYTRTTLIGGQTKTPTFSVKFEECDNYVGGAGIVAQHLKAAGADVHFTTVLGSDTLGEFATEVLNNAGIKLHSIIDQTRPTTNKNAIIAGGYRLLKIDTLDNRIISEKIVNNIISNLQTHSSDAVLFSDFRHGIFNKETAIILSDAIPSEAFSVADSQVASRWGNILDFKNFDLITPNEREARFALAEQDATVGSLSNSICEVSGCKMLILKLGERGIFVSSKKEDNENNYFSIGSFASGVKDAVGAGDALLAYSTLVQMSTGSEIISSVIGSIAAACECEIDGNVPIIPEQIIDKISNLEQAILY